MKKTISQVVSERILILDGAMGTMIQQYNLKEEDFVVNGLRISPDS